MTPIEATAFALGIHEDTGSLTYPSATQRDAEALGWCLRHGARQDLIASYLHTPLGEAERGLLNALLDRLESVETAGLEVLVSALSWPAHVDGISNLAHKIVDLTDCRALVLLVEMDERVFAVVRSRTPELDAAELARALGGGGHAQAASAIHRGSLAEAKARLEEALRATAAPITAGEIMSRPARSVGPDETVAHAMVACQRYGQSGILVVAGRPPGGLRRARGSRQGRRPRALARPGEGDHELARRPLRRRGAARRGAAARRELGRRPRRRRRGRAASSASSPAATSSPPSARARSATRGRPRAWSPSWSSWRSWRRSSRPSPRSASSTTASTWSAEPSATSCSARRTSTSTSPSRATRSSWPGRSREALDGRVRPHEKFGTAVVLYGDGGRIDVVTTRTEFYDAPAALPSVEHATIREDLFRRDFTINAMAASLKGDDLGRLVDPVRRPRRPGGRRHSRPAQPLVHRRPDPDLPGDPLREPVRLSHGRAHREPRAELHRDGARRRPLVGAPARRAGGAARGGRRPPLDSAAGRARGGPGDPSPPRGRRGGGRPLRAAAASSRPSTVSRCPRGVWG